MSTRILSAVLCCAGLLSGACIAEKPDDGNRPGGPDAGSQETDAGDLGVPLNVEGLPPTTYWDTVPLFGHGPVNGTVLVEGPLDTVSAELGIDGSFCIDIPLEKGATNNLRVIAIDEDGERSEPVFLDISQAGEPPEPGDPVPARNVALGGLPVQGSIAEEQGTYPAMTDGNRATGVMLQNNIFSSDWVILRIPTPDGVEQIRIYGDSECLIGDYLVHTAPSVQEDMPEPGNMNMDMNPWTFRGRFGSDNNAVEMDFNVTDCSENGQPCQEYNFDSAITGAIGIRFIDNGCGNFAPEEHTINEIEAWTPEGVAPPKVVAPSCQSGG